MEPTSLVSTTTSNSTIVSIPPIQNINGNNSNNSNNNTKINNTYPSPLPIVNQQEINTTPNPIIPEFVSQTNTTLVSSKEIEPKQISLPSNTNKNTFENDINDIYPSNIATDYDKVQVLLNPLLTKMNQALITASSAEPLRKNDAFSIPAEQTPVLPKPEVIVLSPPRPLSSSSISSPKNINTEIKNITVSSSTSTIPTGSIITSINPSTVNSKSESVQVLEALTNLVQSLHIPPLSTIRPSTTIDTTNNNNTIVPSKSIIMSPVSLSPVPKPSRSILPKEPTLSESQPVIIPASKSPLSSPSRLNISHNYKSPNKTNYSISVLTPLSPSIPSMITTTGQGIVLQSAKYLIPSTIPDNQYTSENIKKEIQDILQTQPLPLPVISSTIPINSSTKPTISIKENTTSNGECEKLSRAYQQLESLRIHLQTMKNI